MVRGLAMLFALGAVVACDEDATVQGEFIAPMDGQTRVALDAALEVSAPTLRVPPDYPLPDLVRVVDLEDGGFVAGAVTDDGDVLRFVPDADWRPDRRYAWTLDVPLDVPHGPELHVPEHLLGTAVFDASEALDVLAAGIGDDDQLCVVLSRESERREIDGRVMVDNERLDAVFTVQDRDGWRASVDIEGLDPAADVACTEPLAEPGDQVRVWLGDEGPWVVDVVDVEPFAVVRELHRGAQP